MPNYIAVVGPRCVACGACAKVCPREAISVKGGVRAAVDRDRCIGCGLCVKTCPAGIIQKVERSLHEAEEKTLV